MIEYSITAEELKTLLELVKAGYECTRFEDDDTLYVRMEKSGEVLEFEFVNS